MDKYPATTNMHNFDHSHTKIELNFVATEGLKNMLALTKQNSSITSEVTVNIHLERGSYTITQAKEAYQERKYWITTRREKILMILQIGNTRLIIKLLPSSLQFFILSYNKLLTVYDK